MTLIIIKDHFGKIVDSAVVASGETFAKAAMERWPNGFEGYTPIICDPNGNMVSGERAVLQPMLDGEEWEVILRPQFQAIGVWLAETVILGLTAGTWVSIALTAVSLIGSYLLRPEMQDLSGDNYEFTDDNVQYFSGETNSMTPGSRIQDVFGVVRVYPKLVTEPVITYAGDYQTIREMYVVSNGFVSVANARIYDESVDGIPGTAQPIIYQQTNPWASVSENTFPIMRTNQFVGGVELPAQNEDVGITQSFTIDASLQRITASVDGFFKEFPDPFFFLDPRAEVANISDGNRNIYKVKAIIDGGNAIEIDTDGGLASFSVTEDVDGITFVGFLGVHTEGGAPVVFNGGWQSFNGVTGDAVYSVDTPFVDQSIADGGICYNPATGERFSANWQSVISQGVLVQDPNTIDPPYNYIYETRYIYRRFVRGLADKGKDWPYIYGKPNQLGGFNPSAPDESGIVSPAFTVPGNASECFFDIEFPQGLYYQPVGSGIRVREVQIQVFYRETGTTTWNTDDSLIFTYQASARSSRRWTSSFKYSDLGLPDGSYEVYFKRLTPYVPDTNDAVYRDTCQLIGLRGKQVLTDELRNSQPDVTFAELKLSTTDGSQVLRERKFNVIASRYLPYRRNDGKKPAGSLVETAAVADAILYTLQDQAGYKGADIDKKGLIAIQNQIDVLRPDIEIGSGEWNGLIDQEMSPEQQLELLAKPHRITAFRRAGTIYFSRVGPNSGDIPMTLINARNKLEPEKKTFVFRSENEPTVAVVRYKDQTNNYEEATVQYPPDASPSVFQQEQTVLGITDPETANRIAQYLHDQVLYSRDLAEVAIGPEGLMLAPGYVVSMTDHMTQEKIIEGEVISVDGDTLTFDETIPPGDYIFTIRGANGELAVDSTNGNPFQPQTVAVTFYRNNMAITGAANISQPQQGSQVGLLYSFTPIAYPNDKGLWIITRSSPSVTGETALTLKQYSPLAYQSDNAPAYAGAPAFNNI